jgi:hypothetical protein
MLTGRRPFEGDSLSALFLAIGTTIRLHSRRTVPTCHTISTTS